MKRIEDWVRKYIFKKIRRFELTTKCNNPFLAQKILDAYADFITSVDHVWNEDIYWLGIDDVVCKSHIKYNRKNIKRYVKMSLSNKCDKIFSKMYLDNVLEYYWGIDNKNDKHNTYEETINPNYVEDSKSSLSDLFEKEGIE